MPPTVAEMLTTAEQLLHARELDRVEELCRSVLQAARDVQDTSSIKAMAQAQRFLGLAAYLRGQPAVALDWVQQALALAPDEAVAHDNLSLFLTALGRPVQAEAAARQALALQPTLAGAACNLGMALLAQRRTQEAAIALGRAVSVEPHNPETWQTLGTIWQELGRTPEASAAFRRARELGIGSRESGIESRELLPTPDSPLPIPSADMGIAENNRGVQLLKTHSYADAEVAFRQALRLDPNLPPEVLYNLARTLDCQGKYVAAEALYLSVLTERPAMVECHRFLADLYFARQRFGDAEAAYRRLAEAEAANPVPDRPLREAETLSNLAADVLCIQGRHEEARAAFQRALALEPDYAVIHSNALLNEQYAADVTLAGLAALHADFEQRHADPLRSTWRTIAQSRDPDRPLRLGFVSGDFSLHPVGMFLAPVLERVSSRLQTVCYSTHRKQDFMTARLVKAAGAWRQVSQHSDETLAELIRSDGIDLLFDLSGHTGRNRLLTFARRPAPVQFTWMGYVGTTGLSAIDYLIADRFHIPPGSERHYREKILRLPDGYLCYEPPANAPALGPLPALAAGRVTFGSFNNSAKITPRVVTVWAEILRQVPDAQLVLKCLWYDDAELRRPLVERFAAAGIPMERLQLLGRTSHLEQMEQYNRIDVALDTFPYSGGLTTCEACWMGVPVVTCPGETFASRHSLSHLSNMGVTETICGSLTEYVDEAVSLARDLPRLDEMRSGLRQRMARSPLCDLDRFAGQFETALRQAWRHWCSASAP